MTFYFDFDHTLYDTNRLIKKIITSIVKSALLQNNSLSQDELFIKCNEMYDRGEGKTYDPYVLADRISSIYDLDSAPIKSSLEAEISDCYDLVFDGVRDYLDFLNNQGHTIYLLSHQPFGNENNFSKQKIEGAKLPDYIKMDYVSETPKYENDEIDYSNAIVFDDRGKDLIELSKKNALCIRVSIPSQTYSKDPLPLDLSKTIPEITTFEGIPMPQKNESAKQYRNRIAQMIISKKKTENSQESVESDSAR